MTLWHVILLATAATLALKVAGHLVPAGFLFLTGGRTLAFRCGCAVRTAHRSGCPARPHGAMVTVFSTVTWSMSETRTVARIVQVPGNGRARVSLPQ